MHRLVIALVTLLGLTAGSFVAGYVLLLSTSTDRLAAMAPAGTAAYVNVYLEPSAGQQLNLAELIGRLPGFADAATLDAKVDQIIGNLLSGTGIDYQAEVKPWLGDQLAIAAWPAADGSTAAEAVVIMAVKDRPAADDALAGVLDGQAAGIAAETYRGVVLQVGDGAAYAFVEDALVIGPMAASLHPIIDVAAGGPSLASRPEFGAAMSRIPVDHLASIFVDVAALAGQGLDAGGLSTASAALIAEPEGLRLAGSLPLGGRPVGSGGERSVVVEWMPSEALAAAVIFDLPQTLEDVEGTLGGTDAGSEVLSMLDTVRALAAFGLGLDLDADLFPLLDREAGVAITSIEDGLPRGQLILRPEDASAAVASLDRIVDRLEEIGAEATRTESEDGHVVTTVAIPDVGDIAFVAVDDVVIVGFGVQDVVAAVLAHEGDGTSLSETDAYRGAFALAGADGGTHAFVDLGALVELGVLDDAGIALPSDARDILSQLGAFGMAIPPGADSIEFHAAISVPDPGAE